MKKTRDDWFMAGLHLMARNGASSLKIDTLCKDLQVTKGSFYHHFSHLEDYQQQLLDHYEQISTLDIIEHLKSIADPRERLRTLVKTITAYDPSLEIALRAWARTDPRARDLQKRLDTIREAYVLDLVSQIIAEPETAAQLARGLYWLFVGSQQSTFEHDGEQKAQINLLMLDRLGL
ncbi:TetR/AcrR family transcriptional regulator [Deinococcus roseus]|uniref:Transcriptional regulator n=1 Tax=Deinococcus roseus TaxID=392414 RepID=A0ABQ2D514_9DEIO|nr:TetR/AcrR family transcriptional regulator [Deinococcus roseus]GGJ45882.1 transcriptional regulator [Deinococcus roseus]